MGPMWHGYVGIAEREMKRANFEFWKLENRAARMTWKCEGMLDWHHLRAYITGAKLYKQNRKVHIPEKGDKNGHGQKRRPWWNWGPLKYEAIGIGVEQRRSVSANSKQQTAKSKKQIANSKYKKLFIADIIEKDRKDAGKEKCQNDGEPKLKWAMTTYTVSLKLKLLKRKYGCYDKMGSTNEYGNNDDRSAA